MSEEIILNTNPNEKTNFKCTLSKTGMWNEEKGKNIGLNKWMLLFDQEKNHCPTLQDILNILIGLFKIEEKNDSYIFEGGHCRKPQFKINLDKFEQLFLHIKNGKNID